MINTTETLIRNLSGGQMQRLAFDLIQLIEPEWTEFTPYGICEGGDRTRKGTPDIWCKDTNSNYVYIQATCDSAKGKIIEDLKKSINKLEKINKLRNSTCFAFINFEPDSEEIEDCKKMCKDKMCEFRYISNNQIANYLDNKFEEIKLAYFHDLHTSQLISINLEKIDFRRKVDYLMSKYPIVESETKDELTVLLKEIINNIFNHGNAFSVEICFSKNGIKIIEDGQPFDLSTHNAIEGTRIGGGEFMLKKFKSQFNEIVRYSYCTFDGSNKHEFIIVKNTNLEVEVSADCTFVPDFYVLKRDHFNLNIPSHCEEILIRIESKWTMLSDLYIFLNRLKQQAGKYKSVKVIFTGEGGERYFDYFKSNEEFFDGIEILQE